MTQSGSTGRDAQSGLTLIEMLIVLVIIGIATSAAVLSVNMIGRDRRVEDEAVRLVAQLDMAVDEGLVSRARMALFWTASGYEVKRWAPDGWQAAQTPRLARLHELPAAVTLQRLDGSMEPVQMAEDGLGPAVSLQVTGAGPAWIVAFDGYSANAQPAGAP